jgi:hypothetical protein
MESLIQQSYPIQYLWPRSQIFSQVQLIRTEESNLGKQWHEADISW